MASEQNISSLNPSNSSVPLSMPVSNTIINQPWVTLQFNNTIMNPPKTYRMNTKYRQLNDLPSDKMFNFHKIFGNSNVKEVKKKRGAKKRKSESIVQNFGKYEAEVDRRNGSRIVLPNNKNFAPKNDNNASRNSQCFYNKSRVRR